MEKAERDYGQERVVLMSFHKKEEEELSGL